MTNLANRPALRKGRINPFYVAVALLGAAFVVTACAFVVMAFRDIKTAGLPDASEPGFDLLMFLKQHGIVTLIVEVGLLAVASIAAMATDSYWSGDPATPTTTSGLPADREP